MGYLIAEEYISIFSDIAQRQYEASRHFFLEKVFPTLSHGVPISGICYSFFKLKSYYPCNKILFEQGQVPKYIYIVFKGRVLLYKDEIALNNPFNHSILTKRTSKKQYEIAVLEEGSLIGDESLIRDGRITDFSARTLSNCILLRAPVDSVNAQIRKQREIRDLVLNGAREKAVKRLEIFEHQKNYSDTMIKRISKANFGIPRCFRGIDIVKKTMKSKSQLSKSLIQNSPLKGNKSLLLSQKNRNSKNRALSESKKPKSCSTSKVPILITMPGKKRDLHINPHTDAILDLAKEIEIKFPQRSTKVQLANNESFIQSYHSKNKDVKIFQETEFDKQMDQLKNDSSLSFHQANVLRSKLNRESLKGHTMDAEIYKQTLTKSKKYSFKGEGNGDNRGSLLADLPKYRSISVKNRTPSIFEGEVSAVSSQLKILNTKISIKRANLPNIKKQFVKILRNKKKRNEGRSFRGKYSGTSSHLNKSSSLDLNTSKESYYRNIESHLTLNKNDYKNNYKLLWINQLEQEQNKDKDRIQRLKNTKKMRLKHKKMSRLEGFNSVILK